MLPMGKGYIADAVQVEQITATIYATCQNEGRHTYLLVYQRQVRCPGIGAAVSSCRVRKAVGSCLLSS